MRRRSSDHDRHIGELLRIHRMSAGLTQDRVGRAVGVTAQQLQKYEAGSNGVRASVLIAIAEVLGVSVRAFFPDPPRPGEEGAPSSPVGSPPPGAKELLLAFTRIQDAGVRRTLIDLAALLARQSAPGPDHTTAPSSPDQSPPG